MTVGRELQDKNEASRDISRGAQKPRATCLGRCFQFPSATGERWCNSAGTPRIRSGHSGQDDQAGGPLDQAADGRAIAEPLDQVAFPVAWYGTSGRGPAQDSRFLVLSALWCLEDLARMATTQSIRA